MKKFKVEITETLQRIVEVKAETEDEAIEKVAEQYAKCDIVLDANDYVETEFDLKEEN